MIISVKIVQENNEHKSTIKEKKRKNVDTCI